MATFFIDKEKFFSSECPFPDFQKNIRDCELPVKQLKKYGLSHIETWAFKRDSGNILNVFGKHMIEVQIGDYLESLKKLPQLTSMNGRYSAKLQNDDREIYRAYIQNKINFKIGYFGKLMPLLRQLYRAYRYQID